MLFLDDGRILLVGAAKDQGDDMAVVRLLPDGSPDTGFGGDGRVTVPLDLGGEHNDVAHGAALQPDGALVLAGYAERESGGNSDIALARLLPDGELDPDFGFAGKAVITLDLGGHRFDAAVRGRYHEGAVIFGGTVDRAGHRSFLAGRVIVDVLFSDGYEDE